MSTVARKQVMEQAAAAEVVVRVGRGARATERKQLRLCWAVSREAAAAAGLCAGGAGTVELRMSVPWKRSVEALDVVIVDGDRARVLEVPGGRAEWSPEDENGLRHLELPGVLRVSVREQPLTVLFARTELLAALGLGGGRYEFEGAELG